MGWSSSNDCRTPCVAIVVLQRVNRPRLSSFKTTPGFVEAIAAGALRSRSSGYTGRWIRLPYASRLKELQRARPPAGAYWDWQCQSCGMRLDVTHPPRTVDLEAFDWTSVD